MSYGIVKNLDEQSHVWGGVTIQSGDSYTCLSHSESHKFAKDDAFISALVAGIAEVKTDNLTFSSIADAIEYLAGDSVKVSSIPDSSPFALPTHRTKNDATSTLIFIQPGEFAVVDYYVTADKYVSGGEMVIEAAQMGDYVTAEVYDGNGVIPEAYRAILCENHPTVAKYIPKRWVKPADSTGYSFCELDTRPLTAKVTAGLFLRVTYFAVNSGTTRCIGVNYHITQKL